MRLKDFVYKWFLVEVEAVADSGQFYCYNECLGIVYADSKGGFFSNMDDAIEAMRKKIDDFCNVSPKNYSELADAVGKCMVWTGFDDCYCNEKALEIVVENFITYRNFVGRG